MQAKSNEPSLVHKYKYRYSLFFPSVFSVRDSTAQREMLPERQLFSKSSYILCLDSRNLPQEQMQKHVPLRINEGIFYLYWISFLNFQFIPDIDIHPVCIKSKCLLSNTRVGFHTPTCVGGIRIKPLTFTGRAGEVTNSYVQDMLALWKMYLRRILHSRNPQRFAR